MHGDARALIEPTAEAAVGSVPKQRGILSETGQSRKDADER